MTEMANGTGRPGPLGGRSRHGAPRLRAAALGRGSTTAPGWRVGVCSWSLQPASAAELADRVRAAGVRAVQLALDPVRTGAMPLPALEAALGAAGIDVVSGMMAMAGEDYSSLDSIRRTGGVVPDATWDENVTAAAANARLARALGITLVTFHAGFVPHDLADPARAVLLERLRLIAGVFAEQGVGVALETGQERADTLLSLLSELAECDVGVNFDPANLILYGMGDPVAALRRLATHVRQVHIKDALPASAPGQWGTEVPVGQGAVDWSAFLAAIAERTIRADLLIEREAGSDRVGDVALARELLERLLPG